MNFVVPVKIPLEKLHWHVAEKAQVEVWVFRDDTVHPFVSGNKWRKLFRHLHNLENLKNTGWSSAGGMWSNHLLAMAEISRCFQIPTRFFIRGMDTPSRFVNFFKSAGIDCVPVSRRDFTEFHQPEYIPENILGQWIGEGGGGRDGVEQVVESLSSASIPEGFDLVLLGCGTGTTLAGFSEAWGDVVSVEGVSALKIPHDDWEKMLKKITASRPKVHVDEALPAFGKLSAQNMEWIKGFFLETQLLLDPVYTWKVFYFLEKQIKAGYLPNKKILVIHTGGLPGWLGRENLWNKNFGMSLPNEINTI
ncbi:MAG: hypothetical protein JJU02_13880 [Cryomorphaceae bacterium]|nr:hypothetical protein [Cryomorphaceae bacterium]